MEISNSNSNNLNSNSTNYLNSQIGSIDFMNNIEIKITGYLIKNIIFQHVKYIISIVNPHKPHSENIKVCRRYSEFLKLREILEKKYIGVYIPSLPMKEIFGNKDISLIEFRKKFLQLFMHELQVIYFFNESEEIRAFLDPNIEVFPPDNLYILSKMSKQSEDLLIEESLKNTRKKLSGSYLSYYSIFLKYERNSPFSSFKYYPDSNSYINVINYTNPNLNYRSLSQNVILNNIRKAKQFKENLKYKKKLLDNILVIIKYIQPQQKELNQTNLDFFQEMNNFQNNFIFEMHYNKILNTKNNELKIAAESGINNIEEIFLKKEREGESRTFEKLLKNIYDWIYKEITILDGHIEIIEGLDPFIDMAIKVNEEIKNYHKKANNNMSNYIDTPSQNSTPGPENSPLSPSSEMENHNQYHYLNFDIKEKLDNKLDSLKEIITLNFLFLNEIEFAKYKSMRFIYFYNCLRYCCLQNINYQKDSQFYLESLMNILKIVKLYIDEGENKI